MAAVLVAIGLSRTRLFRGREPFWQQSVEDCCRDNLGFRQNSLADELTFEGSIVTPFDRVIGNTKGTQHGTVLPDW